LSSLSNRAAAACIEAQGLDLLVDLNGYSRIDRLAVIALQPAPLIVGWFNHFATTGMPHYHWLIGDDHVIPAAEETFYVERILRVKGSYLTFDVRYPVPDVAAGPVASQGWVTFGSLASMHKINSGVVGAWAKILQGAPGTRLFLKNGALGSNGNRQHLLGRFEECGISPERIELEGPAEHATFLKAYDRMDIALDPFPYNGGTTTTEAIWQGAPVLTFSGDRWSSRTSASLLREAGLGEFVAADLERHIAQAIGIAHDPETPRRLAELRRTMRERLRRSPVCDTATFARRMEALYEEITAAGPSTMNHEPSRRRDG
jgi:predicted O-linked N-acetylglucosamine transferase (SPINDLY family)